MRTFVLAAGAALALAGPATAAQVFSTDYDTPNGSGQASSGSFNYWDVNYTGSGCTTCDGAALSGGKGDLTDGVVATDFWFNVENNAGTGPYVGWRYISPTNAAANPVVTFHFSGSPTINSINIHMDNSNYGGVYAPTSILVDGVNTPFTPPADGTIGWSLLSGLNLTGGTHTIQFFQDLTFGDSWTFVSEIQFFGGAVPEPESWAMLIAGFGLVGAAMRRRTAVAA